MPRKTPSRKLIPGSERDTVAAELKAKYEAGASIRALDAKVIKAFAAWSSCMDGKGHPGLADPYKAMDQGVTNDGKPSPESIALAVDDIDCKQQTGLVKIWFGVESAIQDKQIADNKSRLTGIKEQHGKEVAAAGKQMTASAQ